MFIRELVESMELEHDLRHIHNKLIIQKKFPEIPGNPIDKKFGNRESGIPENFRELHIGNSKIENPT